MFGSGLYPSCCTGADTGRGESKRCAQLNADDLKQLMPDAKVTNHLATGSTRRWSNDDDGTFVASTDGRSLTGGRNIAGSGQGTWRLADNGSYCVNINGAC